MDGNTDSTANEPRPGLAGRVITPPTTRALPAKVTRPSPQTVEEARAAVELSRQRISSTLDVLEARIVHGKHALREKLDVRLQFREQVQRRPLAVVAVAAGLGMLLGSLGGGDESGPDADERHDLKKWRKQRKKRVRARLAAYEHDDDDTDDDSGGLKQQLLSVVTSAITAAAVAQAKRLAVKNLQHIMAGRHDRDVDELDDLDDLDDLDHDDVNDARAPAGGFRGRTRARRGLRDTEDVYG